MTNDKPFDMIEINLNDWAAFEPKPLPEDAFADAYLRDWREVFEAALHE